MRLFASRPCEHPASSLLAVRIPDEWHVAVFCRKCDSHLTIPTGPVLAVQVRDAALVDACDPQDVGGVAHIMDVMRGVA